MTGSRRQRWVRRVGVASSDKLYNTAHGITPMTIKKAIRDITDQLQTEHKQAVQTLLSIDEELF